MGGSGLTDYGTGCITTDYKLWYGTGTTTATSYSDLIERGQEIQYKGYINDAQNIWKYEIQNNWTGSATNEWKYDNNTNLWPSYLSDTNWLSGKSLPVAPGDRIREMIRSRMGPAIHRRRRTSLSIAMDIREERARQTLRRLIGEQAYRKFMRDGFITVVSKKGLTYRIHPGHGMTEVYDRGKQVDLLCVILRGDFPPTDSLIMRYLLILNDEGEFCKYAVKHHVYQPSQKLVFPEMKPLTEEWAKLKVA